MDLTGTRVQNRLRRTNPATWLLIIGFIIVVSATAIIVYRYDRMRRRDSCPRKKHHLPSVGCPVVFTDGEDFSGNYQCFSLGRFDDIDLSNGDVFAFRTGVKSYGIRPGYMIQEAYPDPHFQGGVQNAIIYRKKGPYEFKAYNKKQVLPAPRSLIVTLQAGAGT